MISYARKKLSYQYSVFWARVPRLDFFFKNVDYLAFEAMYRKLHFFADFQNTGALEASS